MPTDEMLVLPQGEEGGTFERIQVEAVVKVEQTTPPAKDERLVKVEVRSSQERGNKLMKI